VDINHHFTFCAQCADAERLVVEVCDMESNQRFYLRRAAEERTAAHRAVTPQAREWHAKLAQDFAQRAVENGALIVNV
jgi:hypothetical protein